MNIAIETAQLSKDPVTKVGAVLVKDKKILSVGYNGPPKNIDDSIVPFNSEGKELKEQKNSYMIHAELNAILNYEGHLSNLKDSILYITVSPCHECAKFLAQVGVKEVIYLEEYHREETNKMSRFILENCGVKVTKYYAYRNEMGIRDWILCDDKMPERPFPCIVVTEDTYYSQFSDEPFFDVYSFIAGWDGEDWVTDDGETIPNEVVAWIKIPEFGGIINEINI